MQTDTPQKFSPTTIVLHWIVAITVIGLVCVGVYMAETETYWLYGWHKSFGVAIFAFVLLRVLWRIKNGWPQPVGDYPSHERMLAKTVHYVLIISTVLMPISGFMMSALGGYGVAMFGIELVAMNFDPNDASKILAHNADLSKLAHSVHHWTGYALAAAIVLHIAGAFKHHLIDKDGTLRRMFGASV